MGMRIMARAGRKGKICMKARTKDRFKRLSALYNVTLPFVIAYRKANMCWGRLQGGGKKRVVFSSFSGRSYSGDPRYISQALHNLRPDVEIVWLFRTPQNVRAPEYVRKLNASSARAFQALGGARVWVDNYVKRPYITPRKGAQFYIQTWHGDRAFKKVGFDRPPYPRRLAEERADLAVAGSDYGEKQFRSALHYYGPVLKKGCPRNDILLENDPALVQAVRAALGVKEGVRLLLFAPTFRDSVGWGKQQVPINLGRVLDRLEERTNQSWVCLVRAHYLSGGLKATEPGPREIDVSRYGEMAELLLVADCLITDYSSCAGDFALTGRPIFLYQADIDTYRDNDRELYFPMEESPYFVARSQAEIEHLAMTVDNAAARENDRAILEFYGAAESGRACEAVCRYIIKKLGD